MRTTKKLFANKTILKDRGEGTVAAKLSHGRGCMILSRNVVRKN